MTSWISRQRRSRREYIAHGDSVTFDNEADKKRTSHICVFSPDIF
jgi:hypothetical protein